ncbi:MAG: thymidine phosphorylase [Candidatus Paceibacterota bacterium]|jgi:AMP phosphorylase
MKKKNTKKNSKKNNSRKNNSKINSTFLLKVKYLDIQTGYPWIAVIHEEDGETFGIRPGDEVGLKWKNKQTEIAVDMTRSMVHKGEVGLFRDITNRYKIKEGELLELKLASQPVSVKTIHKKLDGEKITYKEIRSLISDIAKFRISDLELAFFIASAFDEKNFSRKEIYYLTKAISETGEMLKFGDLVADKHSIGGIPGNRITPIVIPIVASYGVIIPKTSSRAITSAAGTADTMEVLTPVGFSAKEIKTIVKKTNGCLIWGGALRLAPADDRFVEITRRLGREPYSKMVVSIMSKQVATGVNRLVIDMPVGPTAKIHNEKDVRFVKDLFFYLARRFQMKIKIITTKAMGPIGRGIGPSLEARDVMRVLQQKEGRPKDLEEKAVLFAGQLLELAGRAKKNKGQKMALDSLKSGKALEKMREIIKAQGGDFNIDSEKIKTGKAFWKLKSPEEGLIKAIHNKNLNKICRLLGAPSTKEAGVYLDKTVGEKVKKKEILCTFCSNSEQRILLAKHALGKLELYTIKKS